MIPESVFAAIYGVQLAMCLLSLAQIRRFLKDTPVIANENALRRYKNFVRTQMRLALLGLCLLLLGAATGVVLILRHGLVGFVVVVVVNGCVFAMGKHLKSWEVRSRSLDVTLESLRQEYRRVSHVWVEKPLPDF